MNKVIAVAALFLTVCSCSNSIRETEKQDDPMLELAETILADHRLDTVLAKAKQTLKA